MGFVHPELLWLFLVFPVAIAWSIRGRWLRRRAWRALAQRGPAPRTGTLPVLASVACMIVALAEPRWGRFGPPLPPGHDVVLLVDVSRSMAVPDAVPNRLAVAVEAARSLLSALAPEPANRAAVVAFAGRGVVRCPLTENLGAVLETLRRLGPGTVRPGGTDLGAALDVALDVMGPEEHAQGRTIVVFSDGEDHAERWASRVERLRQEDVVVHAVAIGDGEKRHPVPSGKDGKPLYYRGQPVESRRVDTALEAIAHGTGGAVVKLGLTSVDLGALYQSKIEPAARRHRETPRLADRAEQFPLFLLAALGLLFCGWWPAARRRAWSWNWRWQPHRAPRRLGRVVVICAVAALAAGAADSPPAANGAGAAAEYVAQGRAAYDAGRLDLALTAFEAAVLRAPNLAIPLYNTAATLFRLGRYEEANERYLQARGLADPGLRTKIDYALGNTALARGDIEGAIASYDDCLGSRARGAALDAVRADAAINRLFALKQWQSPALSPEQSSGAFPQSERPDRRRGKNERSDDSLSDGESEEGQGAGGSNAEADSQEGANQERRLNRRRRMGGAQGASAAPPGARSDSPEDRLDAALAHIRAARSHRIPDELLPASATSDSKDW